MLWKQLGKRYFALYMEGDVTFSGILGIVQMEKFTSRWGGSVVLNGWPDNPKYFNTKKEAMNFVERHVC